VAWSHCASALLELACIAVLISPRRTQQLPALQPSADAISTGLQSLDALVREPGRSGAVHVHTDDTATAVAIERHVARRLRAMGRQVAVADTLSVDCCWREIAARLALRALPTDPIDAARALVAGARSAALIVVGTIEPGSWDDAVLAEVLRAPGSAFVIRITSSSVVGYALGQPEAIEVADQDPEDARVWWQGVVEEGLDATGESSLAALDRWWTAAKRLQPSEQDPQLSDGARQLLSRLLLARRSWPEISVSALGDAAAVAELLQTGCLSRERGLLVTSPGLRLPEEVASLAGDTAVALRTCFGSDPFALARASALFATAGRVDDGQQCLSLALREADGALARRQLWNGWTDALSGLGEADRRNESLRSAKLALDLDDFDVALDFAQTATAGALSSGFEATFVLGRAQLSRGDLVAARVSLQRATLSAPSVDHRAAVLSHIAELEYLSGEHAAAERNATDVLQVATQPEVRLHARNTLGKLLLARSRWDAAELHFASDEHDAACAGEPIAQLRARVNRAIAVLSKGGAAAAREMLETVLADAQQRHERRAAAFALSNLAVVAFERHEYAEALSLWERAIDAHRRLGAKAPLTRDVASLAETRLRLGLLDEAEQALAFGRQALRPAVPAPHAAVFSLVHGQILLARGKTTEAARELDAALAGIDGWVHGARKGECLRVRAKIALEDGDLPLAERALAAAEEAIDSASARAEFALLQAQLARARGEPAAEFATIALARATEAQDDDLMRESHLLLSKLALAQRKTDLARSHVRAAEQLRDLVAAGLPDRLRSAFLARRDLRSLALTAEALLQLPSEESAADCSPPPAARLVKPARSASFIGRHPSVLRLLSSVAKVARSSAPVLVLGESGTGKELISEAIHAQSERSAGPLVKVNCAALVETLLLSELFGHEKGAFTGAAGRRRGRFEVADGGTLFLDEIGDISHKTQVALLRVLQDRTFERVGGTSPIQTDVRIVCATHRDLKAMVASGCFREDLYYRLCGITLEVPPLRSRLEDLELLADHLLAEIARERNEPARRLSDGAMRVLRSHSWPGNVRELQNTLRAASLFAEDLEISAALVHDQLKTVGCSLPPVCLMSDPPAGQGQNDSTQQGASALQPARVAYDEIRTKGTSLSDLKRQIERDCIDRALGETGGNITKAAALLGMKRPRLSQLVKQYGILADLSEGD
jgi:DNA-binding NtrC family response regulator/tetratricopeptide (TPR) repeat protein